MTSFYGRKLPRRAEEVLIRYECMTVEGCGRRELDTYLERKIFACKDLVVVVLEFELYGF